MDGSSRGNRGAYCFNSGTQRFSLINLVFKCYMQMLSAFPVLSYNIIVYKSDITIKKRHFFKQTLLNGETFLCKSPFGYLNAFFNTLL